ncbi:MAG: redox-sensing transcriptional repressor Rex, partial [Oscillibacter sp.]|nr:redox-sensing transcriptional repressor Rex [Oscillibacter sp.]
MRKENISDAVIRRLPRYYRQLSDLRARGITRISSLSLGREMGITASQIRQDFSCFGEFGQQGYGYHV